MSLCSECIDNIDASYDTANSYIVWIPDWITYWDTATTWNATTAHNMSMMVQQLYWILDSLCRGEAGASYPYSVPYYLRNCMGNGAVDMDSILSSMITADFNQLQKFIGLVDAYRVAIWNAPFNADFYAALARGFQKWP